MKNPFLYNQFDRFRFGSTKTLEPELSAVVLTTTLPLTIQRKI